MPISLPGFLIHVPSMPNWSFLKLSTGDFAEMVESSAHNRDLDINLNLMGCEIRVVENFSEWWAFTRKGWDSTSSHAQANKNPIHVGQSPDDSSFRQGTLLDQGRHSHDVFGFGPTGTFLDIDDLNPAAIGEALFANAMQVGNGQQG